MLRYVATRSRGCPPVARIAADERLGGVTFVAAPGRDGCSLPAPGTAIVLVADRPSSFDIEITGSDVDGSLDAELQLETLSSLQAAIPTEPTRAPLRAGMEAVDSSLRITGHVSRRGDVAVGAGEWLAGPDAPSAIEGLTIETSHEGRLDLEYQVLAQGAHGQWSPWVPTGTFVGSRGRALPISGLRLRSQGGAEVEGQALFLGAPVMRSRGASLDFVSRGGTDPLVGLKLALVAPVRARRHAADFGRVRTFRAEPPRLRESA